MPAMKRKTEGIEWEMGKGESGEMGRREGHNPSEITYIFRRNIKTIHRKRYARDHDPWRLFPSRLSLLPDSGKLPLSPFHVRVLPSHLHFTP
mmetsp:Transcript_17983/g.44595  ORF Transcript_17983/g.44595 Transcript_17983/m.44595 type:complete len:92 (+) Transcript_17983:427-702(+)